MLWYSKAPFFIYVFIINFFTPLLIGLIIDLHFFPFPPGGGSCTRERCGSMPSRSRTSSEGSVQNAHNKLQAHNCSHQLDGSLCPHITRPQSMYSPSLSSSYSPPFSSVLFRYLRLASERPNHNLNITLQHYRVFFILYCDKFCEWFSALTGWKENIIH